MKTLALFALLAAGCSTVHVDRIGDRFHVRNAACAIDVDVVSGRVMSFAATGGPNVLWTNANPRPATRPTDWSNPGGDRLSLWPQSDWPRLGLPGWPPPEDAAGLRYTVTPLRDGVRVESANLPNLRVRLIRDIRLAPRAAEVTIHSHLAGDVPVGFVPWEVTQIPPDADVIVATQHQPATKPLGGFAAPALSASAKGFVIEPPGPVARKLGLAASTIVTRQHGWVVEHRLLEPNLLAANAEQAQIFTTAADANLAYIEIEWTGLASGLLVRWRLTKE